MCLRRELNQRPLAFQRATLTTIEDDSGTLSLVISAHADDDRE